MPFVAPALLALAALVLALSWGSLPEVWVSHWGPGGVADGWSHRSPAGVFGPLVIGLVLVGTVEVLARMSTARMDARLPEAAEATRTLMRALGIAVAATFALLAVALPMVQPRSPGALVAFPLVFVAVALGVGGRAVQRALAAARARGGPGLEGWHGLYYANARDARLWVPKLSGMGWTINFAHRWAWPMMLLLLAPLFVAIGVSIAAGR